VICLKNNVILFEQVLSCIKWHCNPTIETKNSADYIIKDILCGTMSVIKMGEFYVGKVGVSVI